MATSECLDSKTLPSHRSVTLKRYAVTFLKVAAFFVGWALTTAITIPAKNPAVWRFFAELTPMLSMVLLAVVFILIEKRKIAVPIREHAGKGALVGLIVGIAWIGLAAGVLLATHQLTIAGGNMVQLLWLWMLSAFVNVVMQELLVRGYIYQLLKTNCNLPVAVVVSTALFTLVHGGAFEAGLLPVANVVSMCLFTTALYEAEGTLLAPIMAHAVWNIVGGVILGGVSLADDYPSLFNMTPSTNALLSGGSCKIEGSVVVLVLNVVLTLVFAIAARRSTTMRQAAQA